MCCNLDENRKEIGSVYPFSSQVSGEVAGGALRLPHVQQTYSSPPWAASQHRDSAGWTGVTLALPAWVGRWRPALPAGVS